MALAPGVHAETHPGSQGSITTKLFLLSKRLFQSPALQPLFNDDLTAFSCFCFAFDLPDPVWDRQAPLIQ